MGRLDRVRKRVWKKMMMTGIRVASHGMELGVRQIES
jgi:hypothetical protein